MECLWLPQSVAFLTTQWKKQNWGRKRLANAKSPIAGKFLATIVFVVAFWYASSILAYSQQLFFVLLYVSWTPGSKMYQNQQPILVFPPSNFSSLSLIDTCNLECSPRSESASKHPDSCTLLLTRLQSLIDLISQWDLFPRVLYSNS